MFGDCCLSEWIHCSKSGLVTPGLREKDPLVAGGGGELDPPVAGGGGELDLTVNEGGPPEKDAAGLAGEAAEPKAERNAAVLTAICDALLPAGGGDGERGAATRWRAGEDAGQIRDGDDAVIRGQLRGLAGPPAAAHTLVECEGELATAARLALELLPGERGGERIRSTARSTLEMAALLSVEVAVLRPVASGGSVGRGMGLVERDLTGKQGIGSVSGKWSWSCHGGGNTLIKMYSKRCARAHLLVQHHAMESQRQERCPRPD